MRVWLWLFLALASIGIARGARVIAESKSAEEQASEPYAPSPAAAPYMSLGYREAVADMLFVRLRGYFGDPGGTPEGVASLCDAIIALDPQFHRSYEYCAGAMTFYALTDKKVDQSIYLRAIGILERGMKTFPTDWRLPNLAGQIYTQDLRTDDPAQRRKWDETGISYVEQAVHKPGAPAELTDWVAVMRTKYGQQQRAITELREMLLLTTSDKARKTLLERLAKLENQNADQIAGELYESRHRFQTEWQANRPTIPATWYVILGPRIAPSFDMADLATGGRDLIMPAEPELEPVQ